MHLRVFFSAGLILLISIGCVGGLSAQWIVDQGNASYYADKFHGRPTASGEKYNRNDFTAAHRTLPMGSIVRVFRVGSEKNVEVRINDCGPHKSDRIIDLSLAAARKIGLLHDGIGEVRVELIQPGEGHCACNRSKKWDPSDWPVPPRDSIPMEETPSGQMNEQDPELLQPSQTPKVMTVGETEVGITQINPAPDAVEEPDAGNVHGIAIQAGSFGVEENAKKMAQIIKDQEMGNTFVKSFSSNDKTIFRVYIGVFSTREEAIQAQTALKEKLGVEGFVVELNP